MFARRRRSFVLAGSATLLLVLGAFAFARIGTFERAADVLFDAPFFSAAAAPDNIAKATRTGVLTPGPGASSSPLNLLTVEPPVPRALGTPCVVELFDQLRFNNAGETGRWKEFPYAPPTACPGPWAKVVLQLDLYLPSDQHYYNINVALGDERADNNWATELFVGGPQYTDAQQVWHVERDVTDYSALFYEPRIGYAKNADPFGEPYVGDVATGDGRLLFYPASPRTPAPRTPDAIIPTNNYAGFQRPVLLPRNLERVYLDVYAQAAFPWYSCVPSDVMAQYNWVLYSPAAMGDNLDFQDPRQGCEGGGYIEFIVLIDGQPAGIMPAFPWLPSDTNALLDHTVDDPAPSVQSLNFVPYRLDLTPFAAMLADGAEHVVATYYLGGPFYLGGYIASQLLVYVDPGSQQVTGAITRNTLAGTVPGAATVQDNWNLSGDVLTGHVLTTREHEFVIEGYVDTSRGRIHSKVQQASWFSNVQDIRLDGYAHPELQTYQQSLRLANTTHRTSSRRLGSTWLAIDRERFSYPLQIDYQATAGLPPAQPGFMDYLSVSIHQGRHLQGTHKRPGMAPYLTTLDDTFDASRTRDFDSGQDSNWQSARAYAFKDSAGSCYTASLATFSGVYTGSQAGVGCPKGRNYVRWFAHPDGSPDSLGRAE